jgi:rubrerythrin
MALETDSYDRYIQMSRTVPGENAKKVFVQLVAEEKEHLARMAELWTRVWRRDSGIEGRGTKTTYQELIISFASFATLR